MPGTAKTPVALSVACLLLGIVSTIPPATATADSAPAIFGRPHEYNKTIQLDWGRIPFPASPFVTPRGWQIFNPTGVACEQDRNGNYWYGIGDVFELWVKVNPHLKEITIIRGWWVEE